MSKFDGGNAFPCAEAVNGNGDMLVEASPGMSLRDYFASQAMVGLLAANAKSPSPAHSHKILSSAAYIVADAMLEERAKE